MNVTYPIAESPPVSRRASGFARSSIQTLTYTNKIFLRQTSAVSCRAINLYTVSRCWYNAYRMSLSLETSMYVMCQQSINRRRTTSSNRKICLGYSFLFYFIIINKKMEVQLFISLIVFYVSSSSLLLNRPVSVTCSIQHTFQKKNYNNSM